MDLKELAKRGAAVRVAEVNAALAELYRAFPDLRRETRAAGGGGVGNGAVASNRRRKRTKMSAAQKAAVSKRMKAYWAARRKAEAK